jgi:hypothetical protein
VNQMAWARYSKQRAIAHAPVKYLPGFLTFSVARWMGPHSARADQIA